MKFCWSSYRRRFFFERNTVGLRQTCKESVRDESLRYASIRACVQLVAHEEFCSIPSRRRLPPEAKEYNDEEILRWRGVAHETIGSRQ